MKSKKLLFIWAALFIVCAFLGLIRERLSGGGWLLTLVSTGFFVPPFVLLYRARKQHLDALRQLLRNLAALSLGLTLVLLVLNFLSVLWSETLGSILYILLSVVSTPMVCSGYWALSIFLWACLLVASMGKKKS